ncbi:cobyric acid synthase [Prosthecomicrobium sp. N25]|uniref:cobyric acid synthase n=1 Tax=Prosthecomicrobium sp. N25 TaxID=3129254 RepID=UPI0030768E92
MAARALMIQGTGSDVGKSVLVAGLARAFALRGLAVRPFKPQNMSNNAAVTADGGEIGRAQALQARAARVAPSVHMNPVLLKPQSEVGSQVVVQGRILGNAKAREYQGWKPRLMGAVRDSFARLLGEADLVLVEGAGSVAEVNLRAGDIANMGFARAEDVPVVLVGDIDRGGVIAQIAGTKVVLDPDDAALVAGFVVNKFRGDPTLFADGMALIERHTGWPALGLVPHFPAAARLPAEDAVALSRREPAGDGRVTVAVPVLPHIANFDDLDPLKREPGLRVLLLRPGEALPAETDLVLLPGSKATIDDLAHFRRAGWDVDLAAHVRRGGRVLGVCGGYQMLGRLVADPDGMEGPPGTVEGLGLLDVETVLTGSKALTAVAGVTVREGAPVRGYEMHVGRTTGPDTARPLVRLADGRPDGAVRSDGLVAGTYLHGLFADDEGRSAFMRSLGAEPSGLAYEAEVEATLDALARHLETHLDLDRLLGLARVPRSAGAPGLSDTGPHAHIQDLQRIDP